MATTPATEAPEASENSEACESARPAARWLVVMVLTLCLAIMAGLARAEDDDDDERNGRYCTATARILFQSCANEVSDDYYKSRAICVNVSDSRERTQCNADAKANRKDGFQLCRSRLGARTDLCRVLGEQRYDPEFEPASFDVDFTRLTNPNPWFPLGIGNVWRYQGGGETITVRVLDKTKLIAGVTCIVVNDRVERGGQPVEDTDDWFGQRKDGTVFYCGESVRDFETFDGDRPREAELVGIDGSFKAGRGGDKPGVQFLATPIVGAVYRQEFSANNAEDAARVLSATYGFGRDADLDRFVPAALARSLCGANDCVVTEEFSPLEPGVNQRKYYARGVGLFLDVKPTGQVVRLVGCSFSPRCSALPAH